MHEHLSSLNSINEIYQTKSQVSTARNNVKSARKLFFELMKDELKPLPKFTDAFNSIEDETPCSEEAYFLVFDSLLKERKIADAVKSSSIRISTETDLYLNSQYGELEILNIINTYGGEEYYHRHSFVLSNEHIIEVRHLIDMYIKNQIEKRRRET